MASSNQLDRIAALTDILTPLGGRTRGQRIEAGDWNAVITVLFGILGIDKTQEQVVEAGLDSNYARKDHQHIGEVTVDWLDPGLKSALTESGASVSARSALADFRKTIDSLTTQVATLTATVQQQQKQIDALGVTNLDQTKNLRGFETRFSAVENLRTDMSNLSNQVQGLTSNVNTVLELRKTLTDATGAPIDVAGMQAKVNDLQNLRGSLTGVDGSLVRLRDFELRIANVEDALNVGGSGGLDGRINTAVLAAQGRLTDTLTAQVNQLGTKLQASNEAANAKLAADVKAQIETSNQATDTKIAAAEGRINATVSTQISSASTNIQNTVLQAAAAQTNDLLSGVPGQIQTAVTSAGTELSASLKKDLTANLTATLNTALKKQADTFTSQLTGLQNDFSSQISSVQASIPVQVNQSVASMRDSLSADLGKQLDQRFSDFRTTIQGSIATNVREAVASATAGLSQQISTEVSRQIGDLNQKIDAVVVGATRNIPDVVNAQVQAAVTALNIPSQLNALSTQLTAQYRAELNQGIATVRASNSTDLNNAVQSLRAEIGNIRTRLPSGPLHP